MTMLRITLFGTFRALYGAEPVTGLDARKTQELFSYLLLYRDRRHSRETLSGQLWGDCPTAQSKKHLRQTLWQLQQRLEASGTDDSSPLAAEGEWISINPDANLQLDVSEFEQTGASVLAQGETVSDTATADRLKRAVDLYSDDLLVGWYQDWCLYERERLQNLYLMMLDRLVSYCEHRREFSTGLHYGERLLRVDHAHERTHRRVMRMLYLQGDRTASLRQYDRCVNALKQELGVEPSERTTELHREIAADHMVQAPPAPAAEQTSNPLAVLPTMLERLKQLQGILSTTQLQVEREIRAMEQVLTGRR